jgi:hypothetical protein
VKLVLSCKPLPTVSDPTEIPGVEFVIDLVACVVAIYPGIVALTVVVPNPARGWNATPPEVVSVGEFADPIGIVAVCVGPAGVAFFSNSPIPFAGVVNVTVSGPGAPARTAWSWFSDPFPAAAVPTLAYTKLEGVSGVVAVGNPCRSSAA